MIPSASAIHKCALDLPRDRSPSVSANSTLSRKFESRSCLSCAFRRCSSWRRDWRLWSWNVMSSWSFFSWSNTWNLRRSSFMRTNAWIFIALLRMRLNCFLFV